MNSTDPTGPIQTQVRLHRGCPTLFVNGRPCTGLTFFFARVRDSADDVRRFARAGIHLFSGCMGLGHWMQEQGGHDFTGVDEMYRRVLDANPHALILPRVSVDIWRPPEAWLARNPGQMQVDVPLDDRPAESRRCSFASEPWRRDAAEALRQYIRHCEAAYGGHVLGYHLTAGAAGEWAYAWQPVMSDYSPAQRDAFRRYLRRRYGDDPAALRAAWGDPDATFAAAEVPGPQRRLRRPGQPSLFDPRTERDVIDYLTFHSQVVAEALTYFCGAAKETLRGLGRTKVVGAFYGYHFKNLNRPANFHNTGHFAQQIVLDCPDVDFVCAPYCYQGREHGHMYLAQLIAGSVRLHGKCYWCEDDTFTFLSRRQDDRSWCPDRPSTIGVLRRNLMGVLRDGGTAWWMDCGGNGPLQPGGQVDGWYRDDALMDNFAQMQALAEQRLAEGDYTPAAQVAVFLSETSAVYHRHDAALMDALIIRQMFELAAIGASFDTYRVADLERLAGRPFSSRYRLLIFPDALCLSDDERRALREYAQADGRTVLFTYGAGIVTPEGLSPEAMADATGFRVMLRRRDEPLIVSSFLTPSRILYGTQRLISPVIYGADPHAEVKGHLLNCADPGLLVRRFADWRSVWSAAPAVPAALLRAIARDAGVHLYVETGEQVIVDGRFLTLHAAFTGTRTVRLPRPGNVIDAYTRQTVAAGVARFDVTLDRGTTATWIVAPA